MRTPRLLALVLVTGSLALPVQALQHSNKAGARAQNVSKLFSSSCIACHVPPDPKFATDRAWLNQVTDTA